MTEEISRRESEFLILARESFATIGESAKDIFTNFSLSNSTQNKTLQHAAEESEAEMQNNVLLSNANRTLDDNMIILQQMLLQFRDLKEVSFNLTESLGIGVFSGLLAAGVGASLFSDVLQSPEDLTDMQSPQGGGSGSGGNISSTPSGSYTGVGSPVERIQLEAGEESQRQFGLEGGESTERGVDPRVVNILQLAAESFPLRVRMFSGREGRGSSWRHGGGLAGDVMIYDEAGNPLSAYQTPQTANIYAMFAEVARDIQMEMYPELEESFTWGGAWAGYNPVGSSTYGAADFMHFGIGGSMGPAYDWDEGWQSGYEYYANEDFLGGVDPTNLENLGLLEGFVASPEEISVMTRESERVGASTYLSRPSLPPRETQDVPELPRINLSTEILSESLEPELQTEEGIPEPIAPELPSIFNSQPTNEPELPAILNSQPALEPETEQHSINLTPPPPTINSQTGRVSSVDPAQDITSLQDPDQAPQPPLTGRLSSSHLASLPDWVNQSRGYSTRVT